MKPTPVKEVDSEYSDEDDDDEFGANDSRSDDSAAIPEEVPSPSEEHHYLEVKKGSSNYATVDDSINDRDLESSVARTAMAPLALVPEVRQSREATIENANVEPKKAPVVSTEHMQPVGGAEPNIELQRSLTL